MQEFHFIWQSILAQDSATENALSPIYHLIFCLTRGSGKMCRIRDLFWIFQQTYVIAV